uniref:Plastid light harvesting protein n=1 Tax=Pinguiococcus pyrenoidosus TaxID=172671 RepID=A0A7R9U7U0_9STRA|mmetsp:Transcript_173/g.747  ORF Transcript_173/g.747 Transcript_173/m.747 type:complete len:198 (+) Transcript_173:99-692(+)
MFRSVLALAALVASASAFQAGRVARSRTSALRMDFAGGLIGGDGPEPFSKNFDPLGLAEKSPELIPYFREAEIKHGRICMLATLGMIVPEFARLPGDIFQKVNVVDAHNEMVSKGPMYMLLFWISLWEIISLPTIKQLDEGREPGDFAFDPLSLGKNPDKMKRYALAELKNGRLAMLAFSGMITQAALTNHGFPFLY